MANTLTQIGIETGNIVEAYHVSQSIDAFTGAEAYDITLSGSFTVTGSVTINGLTNTAQSNVLTVDTTTGQLYYTASSAIGGENTFTYEIGQYVPSQGGVIAHRWMSSTALGSPTSGTVQNYLVVSLINQSTNQAWSDVSSTLIGTSAQSTWDGLTNSNAIVAQPGETNSAAALCLAYSTGSINDWYLPSIDELSIIWHNRWAIAQGLIPPGGTSLGILTYWSSTENDNTTAVPFQFYNGFVGNVQFKSGGLAVRAIRKFNT